MLEIESGLYCFGPDNIPLMPAAAAAIAAMASLVFCLNLLFLPKALPPLRSLFRSSANYYCCSFKSS